MSEINKISSNELPAYGVAGQPIKLRKVDEGDEPVQYTPKKSFFKDTPFGRTLSLRNKTGKRIGAVALGFAGSKIGIDLTPVNEMDIITDLISNIGIEGMITALVVALLSAFTAFAVAKGWFTKAMKTEFDEVVALFRDYKQKESEGGVRITAKEKAKLFDESLDLIEATLEKFGIDIDLDGDGQ